MDYSKFSSADFICDEYFQKWIIQPDKESDGFWNDWLLQHPEKRATVEEAKNILVHIQFKEHLPTEEQVQNSLAATLAIINSSEEQPQESGAKIIPIKGWKQILKIAAIFIAIFLTGSIIYYTYWNAKVTVSTQYSEIKKVQLPDGSLVVLNAHSTISYFKHVLKSRPRRVWLDGEAFFDVKHFNKNENNIQNFERFIVSTNDLNVNVLGTSFNVKKRTQATEVILATGKINVKFNNKSQSDVTMRPGQMVTYDTQNHPLLKSVNPAMYTSWMDKKLILKEASVNEIAQYIQDYYGYKVILNDTAIGNRKMEGTLLLDNMQDVLFALSSTLNIKIEKQENTLLFKNKK